MLTSNKIRILVCTLGLLASTACKRQPTTTGEKIEDKVKDGLDARPNEGVRDAAEDVKDAVKDVVE